MQSIDADDRVVYVGTFSKTMFPSPRLGYLVAAPQLVDSFAAIQMAAHMHPPAIAQAAMCDFVEGGHFARHVRRMRILYAERQELVIDATRILDDVCTVRKAPAGLHLVGELRAGIDDAALSRWLASEGVSAWSMTSHALGGTVTPALILGYAATGKDEIARGVSAIANALLTQPSTRAGKSPTAAISPECPRLLDERDARPT